MTERWHLQPSWKPCGLRDPSLNRRLLKNPSSSWKTCCPHLSSSSMQRRHRGAAVLSSHCWSSTAPSQLPAWPGEQPLLSWGSQHAHTLAKPKTNHHHLPPQLWGSPVPLGSVCNQLNRTRQGSGEIPSQPSEKSTVFLWVIKHTALLSDDFGIIKVFATGIFYSFSLLPWQPGYGSTSEADSASQYTMCLQHFFITS